MITSRRRPCSMTSACGGTVLVEVMIAVVIAAVLIVPLASAVSRALAQAEDVGARWTRGEGSSGADGLEWAWTWGESIARVCWEPGHRLRVKVRTHQGANSSVGFWVNGWFKEERGLGEGAELVVDAGAWGIKAGQAVIVRVRRADQPWGPPWRTVVPDGHGQWPDEWAEEAQGDSVHCPRGEEVTVVHVPGLASPLLSSIEADIGVVDAGAGVPVFLAPSTPGLCDITLDGSTQIWVEEAGRGLDVYF
jgi:hypothetical protein